MFWCLGRNVEEPTGEYDEIPFGLKWRMHFGKPEPDPHTGMDILRLSNNRLVQTHCESTEYQALKLIERQTSIPAYKVIGVYNRPEGKVVEYEGIPGKTLESCWTELNQEKKRRIISDLAKFVDQLRAMTPPSRAVVGDSTLGAALDTRFGPGKVGPFYSIDAFHDFMRRGHCPDEFRGDHVEKVHNEKHKGSNPYVLKFTHANLVPSNILVNEAGRISALIGWESAGWYPEYWEYVQMCSNTQSSHMEGWLHMMKSVITKYDDESDCDQAIRMRFRSEDYERPRSVTPPSPTASMIALEQHEIDDNNTENTSG